MAINWELYPGDILDPKVPYVYFDDVPNEISNIVGPILNTPLNTFSSNSGETNIDQAFSFLKKVINSERAKEEAFVQYLKDKTKATFDIKIPSLNEDWSPFVKEIQQLLDYGNLGLQSLQNEYDRLVKNKESYDKAVADGGDKGFYTSDTITQVSKDLKKILQVFGKGQRQNENSYSSQIINLIVTRFGSRLIEIQNGKLALKQSELTALITMVTQMVMKNLRSKLTSINRGKRNNLSEIKENNERLTIIESLDDEMLETLDTAVDQFLKFPHIRKQIVHTYKLREDNKGKKPVKFTDKKGKLIEESDQLIDSIFNILEHYQIPEGTFKVVQTIPNLAETDSLLKMLGTGAITTINTGSLNAKPDNIIGYITGDLSALDPFNGKNTGILERIERINKLIEDNMLKKQDGGLSSKNNAEYYRMRNQMWHKLKDQLKTELEQLKKDCNFFSSCFLIEDSTKNYLSLYSRSEGDEIMSGPHGGSLGPNLTEQLAKIDQLTQAGKISMIDSAWLTAAIINSGSGMIASKQKKSLEDYLSMFAAILLFDSQLSIAEDAVENMTKELSGGGVFNIHLFSVNNGYYPLSYVLKLTYDSLIIGLEQARSEVQSQGVKVEIYGYINKPLGMGKEAWTLTAQAAVASTKIKMSFMIKLMNVIQNLLQLN